MHIFVRRAALYVPFVVLLAAAAAPTLAPQNRADTVIVDSLVAGKVHMLVGAGGNIAVSVGPDGVLMIDDQFADLAPKLQAAIDKVAGSPTRPRFLINTHFHGDHTGGNAIFGSQATVLAHENVRKRLLQPKAGEPMAPAGLPVVTYPEQCTVHFNGEAVELRHFATSHTDGDSVVHFTGSNVWHLGDLFFNKLFPFIDTDSGGSAVGLERSIATLLKLIPADARIVPGHGTLATRADLEVYHAMLVDSIALVRAAVASGQSADQIVAAKVLEKYDAWSWGFISRDRFTKSLAVELGAVTAQK